MSDRKFVHWNEFYRSYYEKSEPFSFLHQLLYVDIKTWLPDNLLIKADKMTMAHAIELRVPFLDHSFVEFIAQLPEDMKVRRKKDGTYETKYLLKR